MLQNHVCPFVRSRADVLPRPIQSTAFSQDFQEYLCEITSAAPVDVRLVGKEGSVRFTCQREGRLSRPARPWGLFEAPPRLSAHPLGENFGLEEALSFRQHC